MGITNYTINFKPKLNRQIDDMLTYGFLKLLLFIGEQIGRIRNLLWFTKNIGNVAVDQTGT